MLFCVWPLRDHVVFLTCVPGPTTAPSSGSEVLRCHITAVGPLRRRWKMGSLRCGSQHEECGFEHFCTSLSVNICVYFCRGTEFPGYSGVGFLGHGILSFFGLWQTVCQLGLPRHACIHCMGRLHVLGSTVRAKFSPFSHSCRRGRVSHCGFILRFPDA